MIITIGEDYDKFEGSKVYQISEDISQTVHFGTLYSIIYNTSNAYNLKKGLESSHDKSVLLFPSSSDTQMIAINPFMGRTFILDFNKVDVSLIRYGFKGSVVETPCSQNSRLRIVTETIYNGTSKMYATKEGIYLKNDTEHHSNFIRVSDDKELQRLIKEAEIGIPTFERLESEFEVSYNTLSEDERVTVGQDQTRRK